MRTVEMVFTKKTNGEPREMIMQRHANFKKDPGPFNKSKAIIFLAIIFLTLMLPAAPLLAADEPTRTLDFADFKTTADGGVEIPFD